MSDLVRQRQVGDDAGDALAVALEGDDAAVLGETLADRLGALPHHLDTGDAAHARELVCNELSGFRATLDGVWVTGVM